MAYTKGEWHWNKALGRIFARNGSPTEIAIIHADSKDEVGNAHLIAAAPELYEALKEARVTLGVLQPNGSAVLREIDTAIARVEK